LPEAERRARLRELLGAAEEADALDDAAAPPSAPTAVPSRPAAP